MLCNLHLEEYPKTPLSNSNTMSCATSHNYITYQALTVNYKDQFIFEAFSTFPQNRFFHNFILYTYNFLFKEIMANACVNTLCDNCNPLISVLLRKTNKMKHHNGVWKAVANHPSHFPPNYKTI